MILGNYEPIIWHCSAYLIISSFLCRSVIRSLSKSKHAISACHHTANIHSPLNFCFRHFPYSNAAMWALFLIALFTFLRKSNLVPDVANRISSKVPLRADLVFDSHGATLHIAASKTIQHQQRSLSIPLPHIPGSPLCPWTPGRPPLHCSLFFVPPLSSYFPLPIAISAFIFPRLLALSV